MQNISEDEKETGRAEAFSDGVFAVAITLLVVDLKVPAVATLGKRTLVQALASQWAVYLSYALSFLTVLIMWINHHRLFQHIRRIDHAFLLLNGLLLMGVTLVPFPTALLAAYINQPSAQVAAGVYSATFLITAILFNLLWRYASHGHRLLAKQHDRNAVAAITRQYRFGPVLYLIAFCLAFASVWASIGMCMGLAVFFALPSVAHKEGHRGKLESGLPRGV